MEIPSFNTRIPTIERLIYNSDELLDFNVTKELISEGHSSNAENSRKSIENESMIYSVSIQKISAESKKSIGLSLIHI